MIIRLVDKHGFSIEIGGKSGLRLLEYPDFGSPQASIESDRIPGRHGEIFQSADIGTRYIILKFESGIPLCLTSRVLAPGNEVELFVDDRWVISGYVSGIKEHRRPARLALPVLTLGIRCLNPFFRIVNGETVIGFDNHGGGIYQNGNYTCSKLTVVNNGDIPCPIRITMCSNATDESTPAGLFNSLSWNNGIPSYTGILFKKGTVRGAQHYITTDRSSDRFFESRDFLGECDYFLIPPGKSELYAQNVTGTMTFNPEFLYIDGRDL